MTDEQILEKAIQKAIDGGWQDGQVIGTYTLLKNKRGTYCIRSDNDGFINIEAIIFNQDFAKALWGDGQVKVFGLLRAFNGYPAWGFHLTQMVIADDPIKYLGDHI